MEALTMLESIDVMTASVTFFCVFFSLRCLGAVLPKSYAAHDGWLEKINHEESTKSWSRMIECWTTGE
jgi:hypothetical protein